MSFLLPTWYSKNIYLIDLEKLKENNIKYILSDLDNTLVGYDVANPTEIVKDFLNCLKEHGIELIVISNNNGKRLHTFCKSLNIRYLSGARKPFKRPTKKYLISNGISIEESVFVGDQLLTDMACANKLKCRTILVDPLQKKESIFTFINRRIDNIIRKRYKKKNKLVSIMKEE